MSHDLVIENVDKVQQLLEEMERILKDCSNTVQTASEIGKMDLKVGNVLVLMTKIGELQAPIERSIKTIAGYKESLQQQADIFARNNEDITL